MVAAPELRPSGGDWFILSSWLPIYDRLRLAPTDVPGVRPLPRGQSDRRPFPQEVHRTHLELLGLTVPAVPRHSDATILRPHQHSAVDYIRARRGTLLADEMRVGKSASTMYAFEPEVGPLLVTGPVAARAVWSEWAHRRFGVCVQTEIGQPCAMCTRFAIESHSGRPSFLALDGRTYRPELIIEHEPRVLFCTLAVASTWRELSTSLLANTTVKSLGMLAVDECFPAGTMVGQRAIETINVGDVVPSYDEGTGRFSARRVVRCFRSAPRKLVRIWTDRGSVVCTAEHPFLTQVGWQPALALHAASMLRIQGALSKESEETGAEGDPHDMCAVSKPDCSSRQATVALVSPRSSLLLGGVSGRLQRTGEAIPGHLFKGAQSALETNARKESNAVRKGARQGSNNTACDGVETACAGRQWQTVASTASRSRGLLGLGDGGDDTDGGPSSLADAPSLLQGRHRERCAEDRDRGRRGIALLAQAPERGSEEGNLALWARVDRVEVLESGSDGTFGGLCPDGLVYNLEVEGLHTYVANGFVVHNCHTSGVINRKSLTYESLKWLNSITERVVLLSGTPMPNKPSGLWALLDLAAPTAFGSFWDAARRYFDAKPTEHGWRADGLSNERELTLRLREIMLRRTWAEVAPGLPPISRTVETVSLNDKQRDEIEELAGRLRYAAGNAKTAVGIMARLRRLFAATKLEAGVAGALAAIRSGRSVIVWAWHRDVAQELTERLQGQGVHVYGPITGEVIGHERERVLDEARDGKGPRALVANIASLGTAVSLTWADHEIFVELDWNPHSLQQSEMRIFSPDRPCSAVYLVADCDTDESLINALLSKLENQSTLNLRAGLGDVADVLQRTFKVEGKSMERLAEQLIANAEGEV